MNGFAQLPKVLPPLLAFSLVSNLAVLISPIFMMQVLDRVLPMRASPKTVEATASGYRNLREFLDGVSE